MLMAIFSPRRSRMFCVNNLSKNKARFNTELHKQTFHQKTYGNRGWLLIAWSGKKRDRDTGFDSGPLIK